MGTVPIREQFARQWAATLPIERVNISTIVWSKTTVASNNDTIRCAVLEPLKGRHASAVTRDELRNYLRPRRSMGEAVSLLEQRRAFLQRLATLQRVIQAAS